MSGQISKIEPQATAGHDAPAILALISRVAADPNTNVENIERLMAMHERVLARQAEAEFADALAVMQPKLPSIGERGGIKDRNGGIQSTYALWEDINKAILPILSEHGFSLSFRIDCSEGIAVTGVLAHRSGHSEATTIKLPSDTTGSKNAVQAVASSVSYGKRYTAGALLNLTSHGEDDDAFRASTPMVTDEQIATLREWIESTGSDEAKFCKAMRVENLDSIPASKYEAALSALKQKASKAQRS